MSSAFNMAAAEPISALRLRHFTSVWMVLSLMLADGLALSLAVAGAVGSKALFFGAQPIEPYLSLLPFLFAFWAVFAAVGLYSGLALSSPEEMRRCTLCSAAVFLFLSITTISLRGAHAIVEPTLFVAIGLSALLIPLMRLTTRSLFGDCGWWGYPAVIFGSPEAGDRIANLLLRTPGLGLKPIAIVHDGAVEHPRNPGLPIYLFEDLHLLKIPTGTYAIASADGHRSQDDTLTRLVSIFSRILVIPELCTGNSNLLVTPKALGNLLGLEIRQKALMPHNRFVKRSLDLALAIIAGSFFLPLAIVIAALIRIDSSGPVLYFQRRIKPGGGEFRAYKFRTMHTDADQVLAKCLEENEQLLLEWSRGHKLKNDPRVTRVGRWLRKTSFDELPQLWNVMRGDMSLVGPRPIVESEVSRYGASFHFYTQVPGGITGLWQVSGRNNTSYDERVALDEYYVRNWSVWLDFYILIRTIGAVLLREGAY